MAKQSYRIEDFSGGLNRDSDPKDILDNESGILWNWNVDEGGVLKLGGGQALPTYGPTINNDMPGSSSILNESITQDMAGFNLGTFASDFNLNGDSVRTEFYLLGTNSGFIDVIDCQSNINLNETNTDAITINNNFIDYNGSQQGIRNENPKTKYYHADGGIRIYDTNFDNNLNKNKSLIFVNRKFLQNAVNISDIVEGELQEDIAIKNRGLTNLQENVQEAFTVRRWIKSDAHFDTEPPFQLGGASFDTGSSNDNREITTPSLGLAFSNSYENGDAWQILGTKYANRLPGNIDTNDEIDFIGKGYSLLNNGSGFGNKVIMQVYNNAVTNTDLPSNMQKVWAFYIAFIYDEHNVTPLIPWTDDDNKPVIIDMTSSVSEKERKFVFGFKFNPNHPDPDGETFQFTGTPNNFTIINKDFQWNPRITGFNLYFQESSLDGHPDADAYLMAAIDLQSGAFRIPCMSDAPEAPVLINTDALTFMPINFQNRKASETGNKSSLIKMNQLPSETYQTQFGFSGFKKRYQRFKTATVLNRRTYIANVATLSSKKTTDLDAYSKTIDQTFDDRMVKSPVNAFDTFPEENFVDVSINDGDEIIHLEGFSDRILQYKEKILYIINVSQDFEFLESQHPHLGIKNHHQVCKTPYGIAWINDKGVHFYDGRGIKNLIDNKISPGSVISNKHSKIINSSYNQALFDDEGVLTDSDGNNVFHKYLGWAAFMNSDFENVQNSSGNFERNSLPSIGYDATSDKLIILRNLGSQGANQSTTWVYAYNFKKNAWTCHPFAYHNNIFEQNKTNFINNKKGELILYSSREGVGAISTDTNVKNDNLNNNSVGFYKWSDRREDKIDCKFLQDINSLSNPVQDLIWYRSKVISFGSEGKKNVFSVHVTYRCSSDTDIRASFLTNGDKDLIEGINKNYRTENFFNFGNSEEVNSDGIPFYQGRKFKSTGGKWQKVVLKPSGNTIRQAKGIYTFQFQLHNLNPEIRQPDDFAINDITIIYRSKGFHYQKQQS